MPSLFIPKSKLVPAMKYYDGNSDNECPVFMPWKLQASLQLQIQCNDVVVVTNFG